MYRSVAHTILAAALALGVLLAAITAEAGPPVEADGAPWLYTVVIAAPDRDACTRLAQTGLAIDAIGPGTVTSVVDAAGLARLQGRGLRPLAVTPLDFPPGRQRLPQLCRDGGGHRPGRGGLPRHHARQHRRIQPGGTVHPGRQAQRRAGRGGPSRARGPVHVAAPCPRAPHRGDGAGGDSPVHRGLRPRPRADQPGEHARDLGAAEHQPRRRGVRH